MLPDHTIILPDWTLKKGDLKDPIKKLQNEHCTTIISTIMLYSWHLNLERFYGDSGTKGNFTVEFEKPKFPYVEM